MKFKITAVNTKNPSEKFEYELEGESVDSFKYFDEAEGKFFHPKEVLNNKMREINNNLMLNDSPIFTIKKLMNHKDINQTLRYAKLSPETGINEVLKVFDK